MNGAGSEDQIVKKYSDGVTDSSGSVVLSQSDASQKWVCFYHVNSGVKYSHFLNCFTRCIVHLMWDVVRQLKLYNILI